MFAPGDDDTTKALKILFSDPYAETQEGVIAVGGRMSPELLEFAYDHGVFPWPHEGYPLLWFCPDSRGVLDFSELHLPRSFAKWLKKNREQYRITVNQAFSEVLKHCREQKRKGQKGSWINNEILKNYPLLQQRGRAVSVEVWRDERLVGGIYGVMSERYFSAESMFHLEDNVSKLALIELIEFLKNKRFTWVDLQMVTDVCASFGAKYIFKEDFLERIGVKPN